MCYKSCKSFTEDFNLKKLNLDFNKITDEAADEIEIAIKHNNTLQEISICGNMFDKNTISKIPSIKEKLLECNRLCPLGIYIPREMEQINDINIFYVSTP